MIEIETRLDFGKVLAAKGMLGAVAEVGVAEGCYSRSILSWGVKTLYLIDLWEWIPGLKGCPDAAIQEKNFRDCRQLAKEYPDRVVLLRGWSHAMAEQIPDASLGMCHLDGSHQYLFVKRDLETYFPKVMPGGLCSGHDYLNPVYGVRQAVDEFAAERGLEVHVIDKARPNDACFWFERPGP